MAEEVGPQFKTTLPVPISVINLTEYMPKHYVDIGMACVWLSGEPIVMEPDKCSEWQWFSLNAIPDNCFATVERIVDSFWEGRYIIYDAPVDRKYEVV